ncbi:MAG: ammonium transporter, partial [Planctomycetales bacterium]|nr:ammonium transporter [Planctomycetales bacterium]NIN09222.1 ammonium transporter [Planctomycetales bacterium]NIN78322.1 ammonium transporter [Planctomycetales bacterium]NIO35501.1 ammonium transporter [Planctomycetales bacterium]NIO47271.1 ammonium transporter [Planctomycetales bacterium]
MAIVCSGAMLLMGWSGPLLAQPDNEPPAGEEATEVVVDEEVVVDQETDAPQEEEAAAADEPAELTLEGVQAAADEAALAGHNAWMLTCCALVLFMTAPGLAFFYSGLVRKKNVLGVMMQCFFLMGLMTVLWGLYGYSLAFGGDGKWIGNGEYLFMNDVQRSWPEGAAGPIEPMEGVIPRLTHMLFQGMFFIITPALICGAFAERMKFSTMTVFMILWGTLVYCPLCHWVWDKGILGFVPTGEEGNGWAGGALDFAGGTVVHISSGVSALVCALLIGKRLGFGHEDMRPHNLTYTAMGAAMLWVGWFGFNAGSELASDHLTSSAFCTTHFSAAAGAVAWAVMEWISRGKPSVLGAASGAVAGLVCITPAAGFVNPMPALIMGVVAGVGCYFACGAVKSSFGYDDSLDAFGVHAVGGTLGAVLTGVFATRACWDIDNGRPLGLIEGETRILIGQVVAV